MNKEKRNCLQESKAVEPFWSVMIPVYNRITYLKRTITSVLDQDPGEERMQIEVIDDGSTEVNIEKYLQTVAPRRVKYKKLKHGNGLSDVLNACIDHANGQWVHILHDDDSVLPGFYAHLEKGLKSEENIGAGFTRFVYMDEDDHWQTLSSIERRTSGIIPDWLKRIASTQRIQFPAIVVKRQVYKELGGFRSDLRHAQDWEMWIRIAAKFDYWFEPKVLACYRVHSNSDSSELKRTGKDIADIRKCIEITSNYLPNDISDYTSRIARERYAYYALDAARKFIVRNDWNGALAQIREGVKCDHSLRILLKVLQIYLSIIKRYSIKILRSESTKTIQ